MAKKLIPRSKLTNRQLGRLIVFFVLEVPATAAAKQLKIHRHSAERVYTFIRRCLLLECEEEAKLSGEIEMDESYFGGHRKGNRGRGAAGKVAVFGLLKRNGRVYTRPVTDVSAATLRHIIRQKVPRGSIVYTDSFKSYDSLITMGYKHFRVDHSKEFARTKRNHINGIENFWGFAKTRLKRYYGIDRTQFELYLKEMEFRFNHRQDENLSLTVRKIIKKWKAVLY